MTISLEGIVQSSRVKRYRPCCTSLSVSFYVGATYRPLSSLTGLPKSLLKILGPLTTWAADELEVQRPRNCNMCGSFEDLHEDSPQVLNTISSLCMKQQREQCVVRVEQKPMKLICVRRIKYRFKT